MDVVCLDLEGVLVPEIWIQFAQVTGIDALKKTTRDVADYDELMRFRLDELRQHKLGLREIESVIQTMSPLDGAAEFLDGLRERYQVVILSDTFYEFSRPLMAQLNWPTLFCHHLVVEAGGQVLHHLAAAPLGEGVGPAEGGVLPEPVQGLVLGCPRVVELNLRAQHVPRPLEAYP